MQPVNSRAVAVAADGSERNDAALHWAAAEAARRDVDLVVIRAVPDAGRADVGLLDEVAERLATRVPRKRVRTAVLVGRPEEVLCAEQADLAMVVVGKRGMSALPRLLVGSTSLAVAARSSVPVVVVPERWEPLARDLRPLTVGVDPAHVHTELLEAAFGRADALGVPLVTVHGWEPPSTPAPDVEVAALERRAHDHFEEIIDAWAERFPAVEVRRVISSEHPAMAVLDAADAQLLVLGRRVGSGFSGFGFGSVTRAVLHYASCPVLVVPG